MKRDPENRDKKPKALIVLPVRAFLMRVFKKVGRHSRVGGNPKAKSFFARITIASQAGNDGNFLTF